MSLLRQPKWIAGHLLAAALVLLFVWLGFWQLDRHAQHVARNELLEARLAQEPVPLQELLDGTGAGASEGDERRLAFRRVTVTGRFAPEVELLLRNRAYQGRPGWHVLTPLVLGDPANGDGEANGAGDPPAILVDRGWVPQPLDTPPVVDAAPPAGEVRLQGVLVPEQDPATGPLAGLAPSDPEEGVLQRAFLVDVERISQQLPYDLLPAYLVVTDMEPAPARDLPVPPEPPAPGAAPHLAYAVQWFIFAAIGIIGYALLLRRRLQEQRAEHQGV